MSNFNNIPTGLLVPAQIPLDAKRVVLNNNILQNLGVNNNLAFTYEDGLIVFSVATRENWEWRQVKPFEYGIALLPTAFVYPNNHIVGGINYSLKAYNFFRKTESLPLANLGTGKKVYKGINVVNERHEFYTLETDGKITLSYPQVSGVETGVLLFTFPGFENFSGSGTPIFKGYEPLGNKFQFYTIDSEDIKIDVNQTTGVISLSLPETSSIPSIYINKDYVPNYDEWFKANKTANGGTPQSGYQYKGEGFLAKPFTDTITYTLGSPANPPTIIPNTSIQNGLDYYEGPVSPTSRLNPLRQGQKIQILNSTTSYYYAGNFSYTGLNLEIYGTVVSTTSGKLIDMDNPNYFVNPSTPTFFTSAKIYIAEGAVLEITGLGFWNSGYDIPTVNYTYGKILYLYGKGSIVSVQDNINRFIINAGITYPTHINAGFLTFEITCIINCFGTSNGGQGVVYNAGRSGIEFREGATVNSGQLTTTTNVNLVVFKITGGTVRIFDSIISIGGTNTLAQDRETVFSLEKSGNLDVGGGPQVYMVNSSLRGSSKSWFDRKGTAANVTVENCSTIYFRGINLITSSGNSSVWGSVATVSTQGYVSLKNNTFGDINIDTSIVDLTIGGYSSVSNIIGSNIVQSLRVFGSKQEAVKSPWFLPGGALFVKRTYITDTSLLTHFKPGDNLRIATQSTPPKNFIPMNIGPTITNIVGDYISYNGIIGTVPTFDASSGVMLHYDEICTVS